MFATIRGLAPFLLFVALLCAWVVLEQSPSAPKGKVVLRWVINSQERDVAFAERIRSEFERAHPNIAIQFIKQNEGEKEDTMIAGGDAPDILLATPNKFRYYAKAGVLRDLSQMMGKDLAKEQSQFFQLLVSAGNFEGRQYALPWGYVPFIVFFNKSLFAERGLAYPSNDWTWQDYRNLATALTLDQDHDGIPEQFGASFATWHDGFYCWMASNGGRALTADQSSTALDSIENVQAFEFLTQLSRVDRSIPTSANRPKQTGAGLFETGKQGMHGPTGSFYIPSYREYKNLDWDIAPMPAGPLGRGALVAPLGFGVTTQSRHPREALELVKYLCSERGQQILAESLLFVPARRSVALAEPFLTSSGPPANKRALVSMLDDSKGKTPWAVLPPNGGDSWDDVNNEVVSPTLSRLVIGRPHSGETPQSVAKEMKEKADRILSKDRTSERKAPVPWKPVIGTMAALGLFCALLWWKAIAKSARTSSTGWLKQRNGYGAIAPWLIGFVVFTAGPLLFSLIMSLTRWDSLSSIQSAQWVGAEHYIQALEGSDEMFRKALLATVKYAALSVPLTLVCGLGLALVMNMRLPGITLLRTFYYLPSVMPIVASAALFNWIFRQQGLLNYAAGGFGTIPFNRMPDWLGDPAWAIPSVTLLGLWGVGGSMMIYLAGLQNIPTQLYEAAKIDGAGTVVQFRTVTLPMLSPTLFFNLVMGIIGAFQVFAPAFVLFGGDAGPDDSALFYAFYLYRKAFEQFQVGYGAALAWILFAIILGLTAIVFRSSALWVYYESNKETNEKG